MKSVTMMTGSVEAKPVLTNPADIVIPDLWHVGLSLRDLAKRSLDRGMKQEAAQWIKASEAVLETWYKAHEMKRALIEAPDLPAAKKKVAKTPKIVTPPTTAAGQAAPQG